MFPSKVESVLCNFPDLSPYYLLEFERRGFADNIILNVELKRGKDDLERSHIYDISESIKRSLNNDLGVYMKVRMYSSGVLERCESKRKAVNKRRKNADSIYIA